MKVLVLFGSQSDHFIFEPLVSALKQNQHEVEFHVVSAHRNAEKLQAILKTSIYDCVIAGAGLSAHLPGVVASLTIKPVIGIPVNGQFQGLDAFLSISQMPTGVPVVSTAVDQFALAVQFLSQKFEKLNIVVKDQALINHSNLQKVIQFVRLNSLESAFDHEEIITSYEKPDCLNICFEFIPENKNQALFVPYVENRNTTAAALSVFEESQQALSVGAMNVMNAVLFGLQILNHHQNYNEVLYAARQPK